MRQWLSAKAKPNISQKKQQGLSLQGRRSVSSVMDEWLPTVG